MLSESATRVRPSVSALEGTDLDAAVEGSSVFARRLRRHAGYRVQLAGGKDAGVGCRREGVPG